MTRGAGACSPGAVGPFRDGEGILRPEADGGRSAGRGTCSRRAALFSRRAGPRKCNSFTKFYFAALGQISYDACPSIPPEIVFLPKWFYFNLYHVSAWTRTMILPLSFVTTLRYTRRLPAKHGNGGIVHRPCRRQPRRRSAAGSASILAMIFFYEWIRFSRSYERGPIAAAAQSGR